MHPFKDSYKACPPLRCLFSCQYPYAKGPRDLFQGEIQDAAEIGTFSIFAFGLFGTSPPGQRFHFTFLRGTYLSAPVFLVLGSLSVAGVDYRRYGFVAGVPEDIQQRNEPRSEGTAQRWSEYGFVAGAAMAISRSRACARDIGVRVLPMGLGMAIILAAAFSHCNRLTHIWIKSRREYITPL